jgi:hypothetical protein
MYKCYLIWEYHDTYVEEFNDDMECLKFLGHLKDNYKNDSDFHWQIIKGISLGRSDKND